MDTAPMTDRPDIVAAHDHASDHRDEIERSTTCGCFYCMETFPAEEVLWGRFSEITGACPHCGVDSVIGDASGYPVTPHFLRRMNRRWFCGD